MGRWQMLLECWGQVGNAWNQYCRLQVYYLKKGFCDDKPNGDGSKSRTVSSDKIGKGSYLQISYNSLLGMPLEIYIVGQVI